MTCDLVTNIRFHPDFFYLPAKPIHAKKNVFRTLLLFVVGDYAISGVGSVDLDAQTSSHHHQYIQQSAGIVPNAHTYGQQQPSLQQTQTSYDAYGASNPHAVPHMISGYASSATYSSSSGAHESASSYGGGFTNSHAGFDSDLLRENQVLDEEEQHHKQHKHKLVSSYSTYGNNNKPILEAAAADNEQRHQDNMASLHIHSATKIKCKKEVTGLFAHPFDCSKYINCKSGRTEIQDCGPGTVYNPQTGECDWPRNVQCNQQKPEAYFEDRKLGRYEGSARTAKAGGSQSPDGYAVSELEESDYEDETEPSVTSETPYNVGAFDYGGKDANGRRIKCEKYASGLFPHPTNCRKFLNCDNGRTFIMDCGPGTAFNADLHVCDWPKNVNCGDRENGGEGHEVTHNVNGEDHTTNHGSNDDYGDGVTNEHPLHSGTTVTVDRGAKRYDASNSYTQIRQQHENFQRTASVSDDGVKCAAGMTGLNEHPLRCDQYLNCEGGASIVQNCAPGTLFNPNVKICDFPRNVMCGSRGVPPRTQPPNTVGNQYSNTNSKGYPNVPAKTLNVYGGQGNIQAIAPLTPPNQQLLPPVTTSAVPAFNFEDQNVGNQHDELPKPGGVYTKQWTTKTQAANTPNALGGQDKAPRTDTFPIPDMSKVPLAEIPVNRYPPQPVDAHNTQIPNKTHSHHDKQTIETTTWAYHPNKRVSQGGDVPTDDFDLQETNAAGLWPFLRRPHPDTGDTAPVPPVDSVRYDLPLKRNHTKHFSAGRDHITPIYTRPNVTSIPQLPEPTPAANYNTAYYKPTTARPANDPDIETDYLPLSEALKLLMRPYMKNGTMEVKNVPILHHTRTMEEKILDIADKRKDYRTDHTISLEQDSLASADFDETTMKYPEPGSDDDDLMTTEAVITTTPSKPDTDKHDENCNHYHPPHIHRSLRPPVGHSPEFHRHDRNHWASGPTNQHPNSFGGTTNNGYPSFSGWNFHHRPNFHHHHNHNHHQSGFQHDPNHPYHRNHPIPDGDSTNHHHGHDSHVGPNHPNFHHNPNHPFHRNHPMPGVPVESTTPETAVLLNPDTDWRFGSDDRPTQSSSASQWSRGQVTVQGAGNSEADRFACNQFNCGNGVCLPFNKVRMKVPICFCRCSLNYFVHNDRSAMVATTVATATMSSPAITWATKCAWWTIVDASTWVAWR